MRTFDARIRGRPLRANLSSCASAPTGSIASTVGLDELWSRLQDVDSYPQWWPWLREFDGTDLVAGAAWHCTVQPPLPYRVRFVVHLDTVDPPHTVAASVTGEIVGTARLTTAAAGDGSALRLVADLGPQRQALRLMSAAFRPLVRFGHDWILDTGARQFGERARSDVDGGRNATDRRTGTR